MTQLRWQCRRGMRELDELLLAQQEGLFTDDEIREARARLRAFREMEAEAGDPSVA